MIGIAFLFNWFYLFTFSLIPKKYYHFQYISFAPNGSLSTPFAQLSLVLLFRHFLFFKKKVKQKEISIGTRSNHYFLWKTTHFARLIINTATGAITGERRQWKCHSIRYRYRTLWMLKDNIQFISQSTSKSIYLQPVPITTNCVEAQQFCYLQIKSSNIFIANSFAIWPGKLICPSEHCIIFGHSGLMCQWSKVIWCARHSQHLDLLTLHRLNY